MDKFDELAAWPGLSRLFALAWKTFGVNPALVSLDGVRCVLFDRATREQPFCHKLMSIPAGQQLCAMCDRSKYLEARRDGEALRYRCHAGLREFIVPVIRDGEVIALVQCGQVHDREPTDEEWDIARASLNNAGIRDRAFRELFRRNRFMTPESQEDLLDLLDLIARRLAAADEVAARTSPRRTQLCLGKAMTYIESHLADPLTLAEVARASGLSERTLMRLFKREVKASVVEFIQRRRIARARRELQASDATCAEIAFASGFGSIQHFNRVFRHCEGESPMEWRAQHRRSLSTDGGMGSSIGAMRVARRRASREPLPASAESADAASHETFAHRPAPALPSPHRRVTDAGAARG
jgi:AraC-like DNA-binding protein